MKTLKQYFEDVPNHTFRQIIFKEDSDAMYADIKMLFRLEIEKAFIAGCQFGHSDTVESCYGGYEDKAEEYGEEILGTEKCPVEDDDYILRSEHEKELELLSSQLKIAERDSIPRSEVEKEYVKKDDVIEGYIKDEDINHYIEVGYVKLDDVLEVFDKTEIGLNEETLRIYNTYRTAIANMKGG